MTVASLPSIAILIASMNRAAMLRECLASCGSQTEQPDRLAVIDGGSTDATRDVLREFDSLVTYSISEPDKGIFDALNKGLRHVRPDDYVLVLGADDQLYDDQVLADARRRIAADPGHSIYYGRVQMVEEDGRETATRGVPWEAVRRRPSGRTPLGHAAPGHLSAGRIPAAIRRLRRPISNLRRLRCALPGAPA